MYQQVDGVAMGSPLGPVLANIFVGYHEQRLSVKGSQKILLYRRYVDETFSINRSEQHSREFLTELNNLYPTLQFTCEHEDNGTLPFLDVKVNKNQPSEEGTISFNTDVCRKPTFTGQYIR